TLPSRLELNRPEGSLSDAPLKKVSLTTLLYVSPVQISPWCDQTGVPGFVAFAHFHSSTTSGSAFLMIPRTLLSVSPRQSPRSLILSSIILEAFVSFSAIAQDYVGMDDLFIPLWPPAWVEDYTLSEEQLVAAGDDVRLMSALRSDERVLLSVSWPGGR